MAAQDTAEHRALNVALIGLGIIAAIPAMWVVGRQSLWIEKNAAVLGRVMIGIGFVAATAAYVMGTAAIVIVCGIAATILGTCVWALGL